MRLQPCHVRMKADLQPAVTCENKANDSPTNARTFILNSTSGPGNSTHLFRLFFFCKIFLLLLFFFFFLENDTGKSCLDKRTGWTCSVALT